MIAPYGHALILAVILFVLGAVSVVVRRNLLMILIGIEIMLNAAGIALVAASLHWNRMDGQAFVIFVMAFTATEVAVGLALVLYSQRRTGSVKADSYDLLKG